MKISVWRCLLLTLVLGFLFVQSELAEQPLGGGLAIDDVTCKEAQQNAHKIKVDMKTSEVLALLGTPTNVEKETWAYNFWKCAPPFRVGNQTIVGIALTFKNKAVVKIDYATVCAMGTSH